MIQRKGIDSEARSVAERSASESEEKLVVVLEGLKGE